MKDKSNKIKYALVTGGSRGIGSAVCVQLAKDLEYHLLINYRTNKEAALQTLQQVEEAGGNGEIIQFDVADASQVTTVLDQWHEDHKDAVIEVLVNNAGITKDTLFMWMKHDEWKNVIDTSLNGFYNVTNHIIQKLLVNR